MVYYAAYETDLRAIAADYSRRVWVTKGALLYMIINDFEDWNCKRNKNVKGDHSKDWGDPGMQHKTKDKYDD